MAITMIDRWNFENTNTIFEQSHLLQKLRKMVVCARMFESKQDESSTLVRMSAFDLDNNRDDYDQVERDYEEVRNCIKTRGFESLSGKMGGSFNLELKDADMEALAGTFMRGLGLSPKYLELIHNFEANVQPINLRTVWRIHQILTELEVFFTSLGRLSCFRSSLISAVIPCWKKMASAL